MTVYTCANCKQKKYVQDMLHVRMRNGQYRKTSVCRDCEWSRRRARKGTVRVRPKREATYVTSGYVRPPTREELAAIHFRSKELWSRSRWGIVDVVATDD